MRLKFSYNDWVWERNTLKRFCWSDEELKKASSKKGGFIGIKNNMKCFLKS